MVIELWCNGNTQDFGSWIPSSNLGSSTKTLCLSYNVLHAVDQQTKNYRSFLWQCFGSPKSNLKLTARKDEQWMGSRDGLCAGLKGSSPRSSTKKNTEDGEEHYNGLRCLATPTGAAMFADILHSSETHSLILANVYGLVCSTKELRVCIRTFHYCQSIYKGGMEVDSNQMPILGAFSKKRGD